MRNIICDYQFKNELLVFMAVLPFIFSVQAQDSTESQTTPDLPHPVHPSKVVASVVLSIVLAVICFLIGYLRFRRTSHIQFVHRSSHPLPDFHRLNNRSRLSGIDRQVIEALPVFKFSSLKGSKEGLECTVCLSQFGDAEVLRLLPKCKHAFHMNCIDKWLESQASCPLCRSKVDPGDILSFTNSISSRFLRVPSNLTDDASIEIFVQREPSHRGSSRFNIGSSFRNVGKWNKEELLIDQEGGGSTSTNWQLVHKLNHQIVISGVVTRSRWSDLNSSDLLFLDSEMINEVSSRRFSSLEDINNRRFHGSSSLSSTSNEDALINHADKRSMSEIVHVPRLVEMMSKQSRNKETVVSSGNDGREESLRRIWLPIVQRTVQWFARQERNSRELEDRRLASNA